MINRILIRIKVVQILYSYLLTRSEFSVESTPINATRDKKYAYNIYFDLLLLILQLSGHKIGSKSNSSSIFANSKVAKILAQDDNIKDCILKGNHNFNNYDDIINNLYHRIISSTIYKDFAKNKSPQIQDEVTLWNVILQSIILKDESFINASRKNEKFTMNGYELGISLVIETLNSLSNSQSSYSNARNALEASLDKSYDLYFCIFKLMVELTKFQSKQIEAAKNKFLPTADDLNPNTRFIDNRLIKALIENPSFEEQINKSSINWDEEPILLQNLLNTILASDVYEKYMSAKDNSFVEDCNLWKNILKNIIFNNDEFIELLENKSAYWNDDLHIIGTFVIKTIKQFANSQNPSLSPISQYKDFEDAEFGFTLFNETINNFDTYRNYINQFITNPWDSERLAFMDIVIMTTAIAEMLTFPLIPIPVTLNEYIEIANSYSTSKSGQFINGILYSVIKHLKEEGKLNK